MSDTLDPFTEAIKTGKSNEPKFSGVLKVISSPVGASISSAIVAALIMMLWRPPFVQKKDRALGVAKAPLDPKRLLVATALVGLIVYFGPKLAQKYATKQ